MHRPKVRSISQAARDRKLRLQTLDFPDSDAGNAEALELLHGDCFRFDRTRGKWLEWNGGTWAEDKYGRAIEAALDTARVRRAAAATIDDHDAAEKRFKWAISSESMFRRRACLQSAQSLPSFAKTAPDFDRDLYLLTVGNGTLNLRTNRNAKSGFSNFLVILSCNKR